MPTPMRRVDAMVKMRCNGRVEVGGSGSVDESVDGKAMRKSESHGSMDFGKERPAATI